MNLREYRGKRDFSRTLEPIGEIKKSSGVHVFVIQRHQASHLHYDLRLEINGVLRSWALPKGVPLGEAKRLAVQTEDHPLDYAKFEGTIPEGEYGAGVVEIWDQGTYEPLSVEEDRIIIHVNGDKVRGKYCLIRMKSKRDERKNWLFFKLKK